MNRLQANICLICVTMCSPAVAYAYPDVNAKMFACIVLGNSTIFPIVFGIPMAIILQEELGYSPYIEEELEKKQE